MKRKWYSIKNLGNNSAEIDIYGDIGQPGLFNPDAISAKQFKEDLAALGNISDLTIRINSYGGEVFDGNAIYNILIENKASKTVIVDGIAASMASVIAMAADPGKMKMPENAFLMIHDPSMGVIGNAEDLKRYAGLLDQIKESAIKAYQRHAKELTRDELWELMKEETWISAQDALTYGLASEIIPSVETTEPATNTGRLVPVQIKKILFQTGAIDSETGLQRPTNKGAGMKCKHCGKEIAEGLQFCGHCGKSVNEAPVNPSDAAHKKEIEEARQEAEKSERNRIKEISARCHKHGLAADFQNRLIDEKVPLDEAIEKILDEIEKKTLDSTITPDATVKADESEKFRGHAVNSLSVSLGSEKDKAIVADIRKNPGPRDLHSLVRQCLVREGKHSRDHIDRLTPHEIARHAIRMAGMGTSDLPAILADTMNKEFLGGFEDAPTTFQAVVAETENPNFMTKTMTKLSGFSDIDEIPEGMAFNEGKFSDKKETIQLLTYGKMLTLSRQLLINNDTAVIAAFPRAMSSAMKQKMNRDFYDLLTYNTLVGPVTSEDSVAFFNDASHGNLKSTSGVPSVSSLGVADQKMLEQKLPKATVDATQSYLNLVGSILLTGTANRLTVLQLVGSMNDPAATDGKNVANPYYQRINPVFDAYLQAKLTANSKTYAWYLLAGPQVYRNWVVAYLSGNRTPTLRSEPSNVGEALGISYDIFFDYKFGFEDYRGCIYNDGA